MPLVGLVPLVAWRSLLDEVLMVTLMCGLVSAALLPGDEGGPLITEAEPPERREGREDDIVRSVSLLSLSAKSVIAALARWAAERRGREDMIKEEMFRYWMLLLLRCAVCGDGYGQCQWWS